MTADRAESRDAVRTLVLLRHAKSDWPDRVPDHERPLAARGRADAPAAGVWLAKHDLHPDRVVVSDARRTVETWELVAASLGGPVEDVAVEPRAYDASVEVLLDLVRETAADVGTLLLVGHNPGTAALAGLLDDEDPSGEEPRARMRTKFPTAALAVLEVRGSWAGTERGEARLTGFTVPRG